MRSPRTPLLAAAALAVACAFPLLHATSAVAAPVPSQRQDEAVDPPGRVGRIADVQGTVWLFHPEDGEWIAAERNRPLTTGDRLATDGNGRTEVHLGSTTLRLDGGSEIEVLRLDDDQLALQLHNGSVATRLRSGEQLRGFELRTGEGRFTVQRTGRYRFDRRDETSFVTVEAGQAYYEAQGSALTVNAGQRAEFWVDRGNVPQYSIVEPARDAFAAWVADRDRADDRSISSRYVSPEMTGIEDLDRHGSWQQNPEYGALWVPRAVAPGWAPYTTGRWAWVAPWGWTWVDDAPWGFAPFHYGRWVYVGSSWCWSPGTYVRRPVYAPALVAWIGGPHLQVGISVGGGSAVGWVPLAPREVYVPTYRVSPGYVRNVNVTQVTNITNITTIINNPQQAVVDRDYRNRKFPHAVTVVPTSTFSNRQPVAPVAATLRDSSAVREVTTRPLRETVVAAPPVAAPAPRREGPVARPPGLPPAVAPAVREPRNPGLRDQPDVLRAAPATPREGEGGPAVRESRREPRDSRDGRDGRETPKPLPQTRPTPGEANGPAVRPVPVQPVRPVQPRQSFEQPRPAQPMAPVQEAPAARPARPVQPQQQPQQPALREQPAAPAVRGGGPREERSEAQPRPPQVERRLNERMPERPRGNERGAAVQER
ncbi:MAG: FecR domain-containing protein [Piscinibacter sp.]